MSRKTSRSTNASVAGVTTTSNSDRTTLFTEHSANNCSCPCWNIIDGATTVGIWTFVLGIANMALFGWQTSAISVFGNRFPGRGELVYQRQEQVFYTSLFFVQVTHLVVDCFLTMASVAFIWGVQKRTRYLLWPWYPALLLNIVVSIGWAMVWFIRGVESYWTLLCATQICFALINIYCFIVGVDAYRYVKRHPDPPSARKHLIAVGESHELSEKNVAALGRQESGAKIKSIEDLLGLQQSPQKISSGIPQNNNGYLYDGGGIPNHAFVGSPLLTNQSQDMPRMPLDSNINLLQQYNNNPINISGQPFSQQQHIYPQQQQQQHLVNKQIDPGNVIHLADLSRPHRKQPDDFRRNRSVSESGSRRSRRRRSHRRYHSDSDSSDDYLYDDDANTSGYFYGDSSYLGKSASVGSGLSRSNRSASQRLPRRHERSRRSDRRPRSRGEPASEYSFATTYENNDESLDGTSRSYRTRTSESRDSHRRQNNSRDNKQRRPNDRGSNRDDRSAFADDETRSNRSSRRSRSQRSENYRRSKERIIDNQHRDQQRIWESNLPDRGAGSEHGSRKSNSSRRSRRNQRRNEGRQHDSRTSQDPAPFNPNITGGSQANTNISDSTNNQSTMQFNPEFVNPNVINPSEVNVSFHQPDQRQPSSFHSASTIPYQMTPATSQGLNQFPYQANFMTTNMPEDTIQQMTVNNFNSSTSAFAQQPPLTGQLTNSTNGAFNDPNEAVLNSSNSMPNSSLSYHVYDDSTPSPNSHHAPHTGSRITDSDLGGNIQPWSHEPPVGNWVVNSIPSKPTFQQQPQRTMVPSHGNQQFDPSIAGHTVV